MIIGANHCAVFVAESRESRMMIEWQLVFSGMLIGVAVSAPIGPVNIMCIQRSLKQGFGAGLFAGVGAVLGDGTFAAIAAFSLTSVSGFLIGNSHWIEAGGGLFLMGLGLRSLMVDPDRKSSLAALSIKENTTLVGTTYIMTVTNPAMVLGFIAFFGSAGGLVSFPEDYWQASLLVAAVMTGGLLWWVFLAGIMHRFRSNIGANAIVIINRVSGCLIALFGLGVVLSVLIAEYGQW